MRKPGVGIAAALLVLCIGFQAAGTEPRVPAQDDRCAVCGMYVHKYPDWVATVLFEDRSQVYFDGPKDLFRFLLNLQDYRAHDREISAVFVTDYYRMRFIDARTAHFVVSSDVTGPMGSELVPLEKREDAETFMRDHRGAEILQFGDVTPAKMPK